MIALLVRLLGRVPKRWSMAFGALVAFLAGRVLRIRRAHVEASMQRASIPSPEKTAAAMYASLGRSLGELLALGGDEPVEPPLFAPGAKEAIDGARRNGRGAVFAASHTGNWDMAACAMAREFELLVVTKELRAEGLNREWQRIRSERGVHLTVARGAMSVGLAALSRGAGVAMMIDQVPMSRGHALETEFLGAPCFVDKSPAILAARAQVPLLVSAAHRDERGRQVISILAVFEAPRTGRAEWVCEATMASTRALDAFVRAHPSEWLWMHRRWKAPTAPTRATHSAA